MQHREADALARAAGVAAEADVATATAAASSGRNTTGSQRAQTSVGQTISH